MPPAEPDVSQLTYEQARAELQQVVQLLEAGNQTLEESLATWERGEALARRCQEWLDGARERLEQAKAARAGEAGAAGAVAESNDRQGENQS